MKDETPTKAEAEIARLLELLERIERIERALGIRRGPLLPGRKDGDFYEACQGIPARSFADGEELKAENAKLRNFLEIALDVYADQLGEPKTEDGHWYTMARRALAD